MIPYKKIFTALNKAKIRYLVAGGVAVNLHGVERATFDLDLIVHLDKENLLAFAKTMTALGYKPKAPVKAEDFANEELRKSWIREKNMIVFTFVNPDDPVEVIDIFVDHPLPFDTMHLNRAEKPAFGTIIPIIGVSELIELKKRAGRPKDIYDLGVLKALQEQEKER
jgi:hypothetical protein